MDLKITLAQLREERDRIDKAIAILERLNRSVDSSSGSPSSVGPRTIVNAANRNNGHSSPGHGEE